MTRAKCAQGDRFGSMAALARTDKTEHGEELWQFRCACGELVTWAPSRARRHARHGSGACTRCDSVALLVELAGEARALPAADLSMLLAVSLAFLRPEKELYQSIVRLFPAREAS